MNDLSLGLPLSFFAGVLSCFSPCVLPLLPMIVGGSLSRSRFGPLIMSFGMVVSYVIIGVILMTTGTVIGLSSHFFRLLAGGVLVLIGVVVLSPRLQRIASGAFTPLATASSQLASRADGRGAASEFLSGALLGAIWSPCNGPAIGAALALGARNGPDVMVVLTMMLFGFGATVPMLAVAYGSRRLRPATQETLLASGARAKKWFAALLIVIGIFTLTGGDRQLERLAVQYLPEWWSNLLARF